MASSTNPNETPPPSYSTTVTPATAHATPATSTPTPPTAYHSPDDIKASPSPATPHPPVEKPPLAAVNDGGLPEVVVASGSGSKQEYYSPVASNNTGSTMATQNVVSPVSPTDENTVTPLHLLGDQADWVDCPFCRQRVETRVKLDASMMTHAAATGLLLTTIGGVVAPYAKKWKCHVTHLCTKCDRKVAYKPYNKEMRALGTPEHLRQVSKFSAAGSRTSVHQ